VSDDNPQGSAAPPPDAAGGAAAGPSEFPRESPVFPAFAPEALEPGRRGLIVWLGILLVFGVGGLLLRQQELAALVAMSGVFVAAQGADRHPRWEWLYQVLSVTIVIMAASFFVTVAFMLRNVDVSPDLRFTLIAIAFASAGACLLTLAPRVGTALVRAMFRVPEGSHSLRLAARLTLFCLLFALPGWFAFRDVFQLLMDQPERFLEGVSLGSGLAGYVLLALASVGFLVRRPLAETLERLGVRPVHLSQVGLVLLGVVLLLLINSGGEWLQRHYFPALWDLDQRMTKAIAGHLNTREALMVGLSAGIGEEITLRGALQPKLGLVLTSLLFATLHVQYSWFGMLMIFVFGLTLGLIRRQSNTSVAMAVHAIYDIVAIFTT
jgi:hypothetical protein